MVSLYKGCVDFILAQDGILGVDREQREDGQRARVKHFMGSLSNLGPGLDDCVALMHELQKDTIAFTADQRKEMAEAVSSHMDSDGAAPKDAKSQRHHYIHEYLPDGMWQMLYDKTKQFDAKMELFVDFLIETVGLRFPTDDTLKIVRAIATIASDHVLSPDGAYHALCSARVKFVNKRPIMPGKPLLTEYMRDVSQFMKLFPHQYRQCDPPIASKLDDRNILQRTRKDLMPCRNTNKQLKKAVAGCPAPDLQSHTMLTCLQFMMGGNIPMLGNNANLSSASGRHAPMPEVRDVRGAAPVPEPLPLEDARVPEPLLGRHKKPTEDVHGF